MIEPILYIVVIPVMMFMIAGILLDNTTIKETYMPYMYDIDMIAEDCYDVYVSDDAGYTWEYYATYENREIAHNEGEAAVKNAEAYTL